MPPKLSAAPPVPIPSPNVDRSMFRQGIALTFVASVTFSGKAIIVKLGYGQGSDALTLLFWRMVFAFPFFLVITWWAGRNQTALPVRDWIRVCRLGITGFYLASYLDFIGLQYISASLERLILCLQPTLVLLLGWLFLGRRVAFRHVVGIGISYAGILVVFGQEALTTSNRSVAIGTMFVVASTVSYAIYLLWSSDAVRRIGAFRLSGLASSIACLLCIGQYLLVRSPADALNVSQQVIWLSLLNGVVCTVVPVTTAMLAVRCIGAAAVSQIGLMGPIFVIFLGVIVLGESFTTWVALGAVLVISGILMFTRAEQPK